VRVGRARSDTGGYPLTCEGPNREPARNGEPRLDGQPRVTPLVQPLCFSQFLASAGLFVRWVGNCPLESTSTRSWASASRGGCRCPSSGNPAWRRLWLPVSPCGNTAMAPKPRGAVYGSGRPAKPGAPVILGRATPNPQAAPGGRSVSGTRSAGTDECRTRARPGLPCPPNSLSRAEADVKKRRAQRCQIIPGPPRWHRS